MKWRYWFLSKEDRKVLTFLDKPNYCIAYKSDDGMTLTEVRFSGNYRVPHRHRQNDLMQRTYHKRTS